MILKRGDPAEQSDPFTLVALLGCCHACLANSPLFARHHPKPIEINNPGPEAKFGGALQERVNLRGAQQGLAGHAGVIWTVAVYFVFFNDHDGVPRARTCVAALLPAEPLTTTMRSNC